MNAKHMIIAMASAALFAVGCGGADEEAEATEASSGDEAVESTDDGATDEAPADEAAPEGGEAEASCGEGSCG
jgi:hypothetical protein